MKYTHLILVALVAILATSCAGRRRGYGGGYPPGYFPQQQMQGFAQQAAPRGSGTHTVQHRCSKAGKTISIRNVPVGIPSIRCKHCGGHVDCGGGGFAAAPVQQVGFQQQVPVQQIGFQQQVPFQQVGFAPAGFNPGFGFGGGQCFQPGFGGPGFLPPGSPFHGPRPRGVFGYSPQVMPYPPRGVQDTRVHGMVWDGFSSRVHIDL